MIHNREWQREEAMGKHYMDVIDPMFEGQEWKFIEEELKKREIENLAGHGLHLPEDHMLGYQYRPSAKVVKQQRKAKLMHPWDVTLQADARFTVKCTSKNWKHDTVKFEIGNGIAYITLCDTANMNALTPATCQAIFDATSELKNNKDVRIVVLRAEGKMFCCGADQKTFQDAASKSEEQLKHDDVNTMKFLGQLQTLPQFTVALVQGSAMGLGIGLICACDMAIAVKAAHFQFSEARLGVLPSATLPFIVQKVGPACAKNLVCTAQNCNAEKAAAFGLIQEVVDNSSGLRNWTTTLCEKITLCAPNAVTASKQLAAAVGGQPMSFELMEFTANQLARVRKGVEAEDGMKAVMSRQKPYWATTEVKP